MHKFVITRNKIISTVLAVIVLIMLFLSWVGVSGQAKGYWGVAVAAIESYENDIENLAPYVSAAGLNYNKIKRAFNSVKDGKLSPFEAHTVLGTLNRTFKSIKSVVPSYNTGLEDVLKYTVIYRILFILTLLSILLSIFIRITGKLRSLDILMPIFVLLLFVAFVIVSAVATSEFMPVGITAWSVIALICAAPLLLLNTIPFLKNGDAIVGAGAVNESGTAGSVKKSIGASLSGIKDKAGNLIKNIGTGRKVTYQCSVCGHDLQPNEKICPVCRSSAEDRMSTSVCKNCGCRIPSGSKYCTVCGAKQN